MNSTLTAMLSVSTASVSHLTVPRVVSSNTRETGRRERGTAAHTRLACVAPLQVDQSAETQARVAPTPPTLESFAPGSAPARAPASNVLLQALQALCPELVGALPRARAASSFGPHRGITCTPSRVAAISSALLRPLRGSPCACSSPRPRRPSPGDDARGRRLGNSLLYNLSSYLSRTSDLRSRIGATSSTIKLRPRTSPAGSASDLSLTSFTPSAHGLGGRRPARATTRPPPG